MECRSRAAMGNMATPDLAKQILLVILKLLLLQLVGSLRPKAQLGKLGKVNGAPTLTFTKTIGEVSELQRIKETFIEQHAGYYGQQTGGQQSGNAPSNGQSS